MVWGDGIDQLPFETVLYLALMVVLLGMGVIWFWLIARLYRRLERDHPEKYLAMGKPTLFWRSSLVSSFDLLRFIFLQEHRELNDAHLSRLRDRMRLLLLTYTLLLAVELFLLARIG
ncbi:MAG TPA: hypothetical protein PKH07_08910 [bacterium]|nr:hypothetical protein [bacterium]